MEKTSLFQPNVPLSPGLRPHQNEESRKTRIYLSKMELSSPSYSKRMRIGKYEHLHPVLQLMKQRLETGSKPGARNDHNIVALCIEGGGMRGAVAAGMVAALRHCGLSDTVDRVYGASAGSIVGSYFITDQLPLYGARIYYDIICAPNKQVPFIKPLALITNHRPVLLLDRLVDQVMCHDAPLDWSSFCTRVQSQPLHPIASSIKKHKSSRVLKYSDFESFRNALRASARLPGITGDPVWIDECNDLFIDSMFYEAIPFRTAVEEGASHVLVLRTRRHDDKVATKPGVYENMIAPRSLRRASKLYEIDSLDIISHLRRGAHIEQYACDVRTLQMTDETGFYKSNGCSNMGSHSILSVVPHRSHRSVGQLERRSSKIFHAVRDGFAAAYHALSPFADESENEIDIAQSVARFVFPDSEIEAVHRRHHA